jgi:hypothetical protein
VIARPHDAPIAIFQANAAPVPIVFSVRNFFVGVRFQVRFVQERLFFFFFRLPRIPFEMLQIPFEIGKHDSGV